MTTVRLLHVVQDTDSGLFLCPSEDGDVGFTKLISDAGSFTDMESAIDTAMFVLGRHFVVFSYYNTVA